MMLSLNELRDRPSDRTFTFSLSLEPLEVLGNMYAVRERPVATLNVSCDGRTVSLRGEARGVFSTECARCLCEATFTVTAPIAEEWLLAGEALGELDDINASGVVTDDGDHLDLGEYAVQALSEEIPLRVLCQSHCRGLCPSCGANLNERDCLCASQDIDPRLAVLRCLLHNKGGVENGGSEKKNI